MKKKYTREEVIEKIKKWQVHREKYGSFMKNEQTILEYLYWSILKHWK